MRRPVLRAPGRKLSYTFMAAEAYWILSGDDRVATIAPYNSHIADFSDDGELFFGAYGTKIISQLPYVVEKLTSDQDTRQAGLTIWRESPPDTKDVPCTIAVFFSLRRQTLNAHVFMRSSDLWLGLPYDIFNFSMLSHLVCGMLPAHPTPGTLHLTAASSHLYEKHWELTAQLYNQSAIPQAPVPEMFARNPDALMDTLFLLRETKPGSALRWWE
jgi:thymidylate synthase